MTATAEAPRRQTRNQSPYTPEEKRKLKEWHGLATTTRSTTPKGAKERKAGEKFCQLIAEKKKLGFSWRELAEPLGLKGRTVNAYLSRHGYTERLEPSRPPYQNRSINDNHRTKTFYPCGKHRIGEDPAYPPSKPGGQPRCATCIKEKRRRRWTEKEYPRELARRQAIEAAREKNRRMAMGEGEAA